MEIEPVPAWVYALAGSIAGGHKALEEMWYAEAHGCLPADAMFISGIDYDEDGVIFTHVNLYRHDD